jgi:hypothetical protein
MSGSHGGVTAYRQQHQVYSVAVWGLVTGNQVLVRTHSGTFGYTPDLVEWPFY